MCVNTKEYGYQAFTDYDDMRNFLSRCKTIIGHNLRRWDVPVLERILGIDLSKHTIVDTLALSWYLKPNRKSHSLDSYGTEFLIFKPKISDWENLSIEEYIHRCTEDVKINTKLWGEQYNYLKRLYSDEAGIWRLIKYLSFKLYCAHLQERSQWKIDVKATEKALQKLEDEKATRIAKLTQMMPSVPVRAVKRKPKRLTRKDGSLTQGAQDWFDLLLTNDLPDDTEEIEITVGYDPPNPSSTKQIKDWLFDLGWKPQTFEYKDNREIPQINQKFGKGLDPGIKELIEDHPELEFLEGLSVLGHRIGILKGFLKEQTNGYLQAKINGLTNTLRFQHVAPCVNLPKTDRLYASDIRNVLIADTDHELIGADMSSLETLLKMHYIYPFDPGYVKSMQKDDYDPHLDIALVAGLLDEDQVAEYKLYVKTEGEQGSKKNSKIRDIAKNCGYALQYQAMPPRLVKTTGISLETAKQVYKGYWKLNWAIKEFAKTVTIKNIDGQMWLYNQVSGLWYSLRTEKDIFSTTIQGTASFVFDLWVKYVLDKRPQLTAQFHDEIVLHTLKTTRKEITKLLTDAIDKTNETLKLNVPLKIGIQYGDTYGAIH